MAKTETKEPASEPAKTVKRMPETLRAAAACERILDKVPPWAQEWAVNYLLAKYIQSKWTADEVCVTESRQELAPAAKGDLPF